MISDSGVDGLLSPTLLFQAFLRECGAHATAVLLSAFATTVKGVVVFVFALVRFLHCLLASSVNFAALAVGLAREGMLEVSHRTFCYS